MDLEKMTDRQLAEHIAGYSVGTAQRIMGEQELLRRQNRPALKRATIALWISFAALIVSVASLLTA